jgi:excisionase family DNA binding protein
VDNSALLTVKQVGDELGLSKYQVYRRIVRGDLKAVRAHRPNIHYLIPTEELQRYKDAGGNDMLSAPGGDGPDMLRVSDVAQMTGFTVDTVRAMCYAGRLPYVKGRGLRGHLRIPRVAVQEMLNTAAK